MIHPPYLLPWVRVLLLIRSITSTTWGNEAWPQVKPLLRCPGDAPKDCAGRVVELDTRGRRLRAALAVLVEGRGARAAAYFVFSARTFRSQQPAWYAAPSTRDVAGSLTTACGD